MSAQYINDNLNRRVVELHKDVCEYEIVPALAKYPVGKRVIWQGKTGIHEGQGKVRIFGGGEHYGYVGHCRQCDGAPR